MKVCTIAGDLAQVMQNCRDKQQPLPESVIVKWTAETCRALAYLHGQLNILHRDVKPVSLNDSFAMICCVVSPSISVSWACHRADQSIAL